MKHWLLISVVFAALAGAGEPTPPPEEPPVPKPAEPEPPKSESEPPKSEPAPPKPEPVPAPKEDKPGENAAETVPLPADIVPGKESAAAVVAKLDENESLTLTTEATLLQPGQPAVFKLYGPEIFLRAATGQFFLQDQFGRLVGQGTLKIADLPYKEGEPRQIQINVPAPLVPYHTFELSVAGADGRSGKLQTALRVVGPQMWRDWIALTSTPPASGDWSALQALGVTGGLQYRMHPARREALRKGGAPFFVENVSRQMLSRYHTEPGLWEKTVAALQSGNRAAFAREPSLCTPEFAQDFAAELTRHAEIYSKDPPLFYSLASEPSMTRLAAAADFDFHPQSLAEFQRWLERDVYGTLKALNTAWDTQFAAWGDVQPMTTDEARLRLKDGVLNFGPWIDFREFQDHTFAKILRDGGNLIRTQHPDAKVGITGAMGPFAFGGWDWGRLANALDAVEAYDIGGARALWRDLAPGKPALAALTLADGGDVPAAAAEATRTMWSLVLEGGPRGVLLWDDNSGRGLIDAEKKPSPLAAALAPALKSLQQNVAPVLSTCRREDDGVAVLYSPASIRMWWLLEANKLHGDKWLQAWGADTGAERRESPQLRLRESWGKLLDDLGLGWRFVSSQQLENREILLGKNKPAVLVLPRVIALSDREIDVIKQFVADGGRVVADSCCGKFDEHGKMRGKPALDELLEVDSVGEPFFVEPMNPLESVVLPQNAELGSLGVKELPPVFSDKPKWLGAKDSCGEYRRSPVLASGKLGTFLNLDLTDYLRWRLHPDQPRAKTTRDALAAVFKPQLQASAVDWKNSRLPAGTQVTRLRLGGEAAGAIVLALRRNPQQRLHELGTEAEGNWAFEKPESFVLAFKQPLRVGALYPEYSTPKQIAKIEGTLDPDAALLYVLPSTDPKPLTLTLAPEVKAGQAVELKLPAAGSDAYRVRITAPDGSERAHYGGTFISADGALTHRVPFALNDPAGKWQISVRSLSHGGEAKAVIEVKPLE